MTPIANPYHLNWHPHNFGVELEENMRGLGSILEAYSRLGDRYGGRRKYRL